MDPNIPPRPSGIPRLSKLPVPKPSPAGSLTPSRLRPTASVDTLRKKPSQSSFSSPTGSASLRRTSGLTRGTSVTTSTATSRATPRQDDNLFKKPIGRPPSRQARVQSQQRIASQNRAQQQQEDVLGSLDGFRASSRASSRASFREDDHIEFTNKTPPKDKKPTAKKSRPSLSDRTIESLSQVPASPAPRRRQSSIFSPESPLRPPSRSSSALGHYNKRPDTSDGAFSASVSRLPATPSSAKSENVALKGSMTAPGKRSVSAAIPRKPSQTLRQPSRTSNTSSVQAPSSVRSTRTSNSLATLKPRPSLNGLFDKSRAPSTTSTPVRRTTKPVQKESLQVDSDSSARKASTSSAALRDQIAKAKAARKAVAAKTAPTDSIANAQFDFGLDNDPFNQMPKGGDAVIRKRVDAARSDGRLNISAMGLSEIPEVVLKMYEFDSNQSSSIAWGEVVDLVRFNAADNDLENISDLVFPDVDPQAASLDEDAPNMQFAGVEFLDLHGNKLGSIPLGLRRMSQLTSLNLSRNRLKIAAFEIIGQILSLKELKVAENDLQGSLPTDSIGRLSNLQNLDLQGNQLTELPADMSELVNLHVLNVTSNRLTSLDMEVLLALPIVQISAVKNNLQGVLISGSMENTSLQALNVSGNSLTSLTTDSRLQLSALQTLDLSVNRISSLPDISGCRSLVTILAGENKLQDLPEGFVELLNVKKADFSSNDISKVDDRIALMESLDTISLAANPLRERKYLTMVTSDLKQHLRAKLVPAQDAEGQTSTLDELESDLVSEGGGHDNGWKLTPSGTLDLSKKSLCSLPEEEFGAFATKYDIKQLNLQQNQFECIPQALELSVTLTVLNLSHNNISLALEAQLSLPFLRDLKLAGNRITNSALANLQTHLSAPNLQTLDLTYNKLDGALPALKTAFPNLFALQVADNAIDTVEAKVLEGLKVVDLSNNSIEKLDARIGLLAGRLTGLNVEGNTFRVPGYQVLRKGTEAVLAWLRDRLPEEEREAFE
ncbi:L domain-like protein [Pseudovirgaria hyperparasitica]|uniref:L domain-like protein n=1 Tax=Pseudovirgaria hyperparasitica TaxID=470096 RepID=A0A6A6WFB3_9PEZI|nr:L domain-like protein [Pseudovirgaria hyperparasitica]KAF2761235.1 L domain-like protein [Pseudovirgaria hyperparasitica]